MGYYLINRENIIGITFVIKNLFALQFNCFIIWKLKNMECDEQDYGVRYFKHILNTWKYVDGTLFCLCSYLRELPQSIFH
jgi:hypothetical protein